MYHDDNYFPTPEHLALKLVQRIEIKPGERILEPSAGTGHIARVIRRLYPHNPLWVIERSWPMAKELKRQGFSGFCTDFLTFKRPVDVIIANPPFRNNFQDIDHFKHAWEILNPGGRMAFILHEYSAFPKLSYGKPYEFTRFLKEIKARGVKNPPGSFANAERPTNTGTSMVWVEKPYLRHSSQPAAADFVFS
ncbi:MAG TPA: class I SAM-dependent methyltransferase [Bellilinea sp.]|nr:class I SAM-dependent methyltransferase [Bellilinea sp.]